MKEQNKTKVSKEMNGNQRGRLTNKQDKSANNIKHYDRAWEDDRL